MLMDINEKRLNYSKKGVERIVRAGGHRDDGHEMSLSGTSQ